MIGPEVLAQPTVLGTNAMNYPNYATYNLNSFGKLRTYRDSARVSASSGQANWEFLLGSSGSPNYTTNWRPYLGGLTLFAFDSIISPHSPSATAYAAAQYNTSSGGQSGLLPAITAGRFYTFNIGDVAAGNNYMAVWETNYNPAQLVSLTQAPTVVCAGGSYVTVTVTSNKSLDASEKAYLRYATDAAFLNDTLIQITFSGTTGTAIIQTPSSGSIYYYAFTSKLSLSSLAPSGVVNETYCDISTLNMNNNSGSNYSFTVTVGTVPSSLGFTPTSLCNGVATEFTASATNASEYSWNLGSGFGAYSSSPTSSSQSFATGTHSITLRARNTTSGCVQSYTQSISVAPQPSSQTVNPTN